MPDSSRAFAAKELGVPRDASPNRLRSALLQQLANNHFVPSENLLASLTLLKGPKLPLTPDVDDQLNRFDLVDVEAFITSYWSFEPHNRLQRWTELRDQCKNPAAIDRLSRVEAGLQVEWKDFPDETQNQLARTVRELFLLDTRAQTARRLEWMASPEAASMTKEAAQALQLLDPMLCDLEPQLFHHLLQLERPTVSVEAMDPEALEKQITTENIERTRIQNAPPEEPDEATLAIFIAVITASLLLIYFYYSYSNSKNIKVSENHINATQSIFYSNRAYASVDNARQKDMPYTDDIDEKNGKIDHFNSMMGINDSQHSLNSLSQIQSLSTPDTPFPKR